MTTFHYKIINAQGKETKGRLDAKDKFELYHELKKEGATLISVSENSTGFSSLSSIPFLGRIKMHDKIIFARNLGSMIDAGLPITRGLSIMERQAGNARLKKLLTSLNESIAKG